jgi:urea transporter
MAWEKDSDIVNRSRCIRECGRLKFTARSLFRPILGLAVAPIITRAVISSMHKLFFPALTRPAVILQYLDHEKYQNKPPDGLLK